jgi:hypothetical protein
LHLKNCDGLPYEGGVVLGEPPVGKAQTVLDQPASRSQNARLFAVQQKRQFAACAEQNINDVPRLGNRLGAVVAGHFDQHTQALAEGDIADGSLCVASIPKVGLDADVARIEQGDRFDGVFFVEVDRAIVRSDRSRRRVPMSCTPSRCDPCARADADRHAGNGLANGRQARGDGIGIVSAPCWSLTCMWSSAAPAARTDRASAASSDAETGTLACTVFASPPLRQA